MTIGGGAVVVVDGGGGGAVVVVVGGGGGGVLLRAAQHEVGVDPAHRSVTGSNTLSRATKKKKKTNCCLTLGVGRSRVRSVAALSQLYRGVRSQGLSLEELRARHRETHTPPKKITRSRSMNSGARWTSFSRCESKRRERGSGIGN